jgi:hypothetical protein
VIIK